MIDAVRRHPTEPDLSTPLSRFLQPLAQLAVENGMHLTRDANEAARERLAELNVQRGLENVVKSGLISGYNGEHNVVHERVMMLFSIPWVYLQLLY